MTTTNPTKDNLREEIEVLHETLSPSFTRALVGIAIFEDLKDSYDDLDSRSALRGIYETLIVIGDRLGEILDQTDSNGDDTDSFDDAPEDTAADADDDDTTDDGEDRVLLAEKKLAEEHRRIAKTLLKTLL